MLMNKDVNCSNFIGLLGCIQKHHGDEGVRQVLKGLIDNEKYLITDKESPSKPIPVQEYHLRDSAYWVSYEFCLALFANAKKVFGSPHALIKAGEEAAIDYFSKTKIFISRISSTGFVIKQAAKINSRFNKTKEVKVVELTANSATFELHYPDNFFAHKDICNWNLGVYTGIIKMTGVTDVKSEERQCAADGHEHCVLHVTWRRKPNFFKRLLRSIQRVVSGDLLAEYEATVNDRDQLIADLTQSEERYRALTDQSLTGIFIHDDGRLIYVNDCMARMLDYSSEEMIGKQLWDFVSAEDRRGVQKRESASSTGIDAAANYEFRATKKSGEQVWFEILSNSILYAGRHMRMGNVMDLTSKRQAEEALRESEMKFSGLFELSPQAIILSDLSTDRIVDVNEKFCELSQYKKNEAVLLTLTDADFFIGKEKQKFIEALHISGEVNGLETDFKARDDTVLNTLVFSRPIRIAGKAFALTICVNVTDRIRLEKQLQQARKMEALGLMAGGIAHDLNNILSGIVSYPDLILMDLPEDSPLSEPIKTMKKSGQVAADVVSDLLSFARGVATAKEVSNLNTIITEYFTSAEHVKIEKMHPSITFNIHLDHDLKNTNCAATHIKKCLLNLVANASESIKDIGTVILSTANHYLDEPIAGYEYVRQGEYVKLSVSDNGSGISPHDLDRIFEPFYTKKTMGRSGTGLGLAIVWNTLQDHEGYIHVESGKQGTLFELYFPASIKELTVRVGDVPFQDYAGHGEKILVVDDEDQRKIASGLLIKLGYHAVAVASGEKAVEYLTEHSVDLIILDMIMPKGMNGRETYERVLNIHPEQKAIIASGFAETDDVKQTQHMGAWKYIIKPYTLEEIGIAVRDELKK